MAYTAKFELVEETDERNVYCAVTKCRYISNVKIRFRNAIRTPGLDGYKFHAGRVEQTHALLEHFIPTRLLGLDNNIIYFYRIHLGFDGKNLKISVPKHVNCPVLTEYSLDDFWKDPFDAHFLYVGNMDPSPLRKIDGYYETFASYDRPFGIVEFLFIFSKLPISKVDVYETDKTHKTKLRLPFQKLFTVDAYKLIYCISLNPRVFDSTTMKQRCMSLSHTKDGYQCGKMMHKYQMKYDEFYFKIYSGCTLEEMQKEEIYFLKH